MAYTPKVHRTILYRTRYGMTPALLRAMRWCNHWCNHN